MKCKARKSGVEVVSIFVSRLLPQAIGCMVCFRVIFAMLKMVSRVIIFLITLRRVAWCTGNVRFPREKAVKVASGALLLLIACIAIIVGDMHYLRQPVGRDVDLKV